MRIQSVLIFTTFLLGINYVFAQDTLFYNYYGQKAIYKYNRVLYEPNPTDSGAFKAYFIENDQLAIEGAKNKGEFMGDVTFYFPNGQKRKTANYYYGTEKGIITNWYDSGKKKSIYETISPKEKRVKNIDQFVRILEQYDSLGNFIVKNGKGNGFFGDKNGSTSYEFGPIKDGLKNGKWQGELYDHQITFEERYKYGKFLDGISKDTTGHSYKYKQLFKIPSYKNGINALYLFLKRQLRYPERAQRLGIEGRVYVQFITQKDGTPSQIAVLKGIGGGCDEEAVRVVKKMPRWYAGKIKGQVVKFKFILPITFKLR